MFSKDYSLVLDSSKDNLIGENRGNTQLIIQNQ